MLLHNFVSHQLNLNVLSFSVELPQFMKSPEACV